MTNKNELNAIERTENMKETNSRKKQRGFTLAETLITLVILGIVAAITVPQLVRRQQEAANRIKFKKAMTAYETAIKYLADNNYFTPTMEEFYMYLKGNLQIEKGVLITLDDGLLFKSADEVLDKYGLKATGFITTSLDVNTKDYKAIEPQSHTHNLHRNYVCSGGNQGGAILCASKANIVADLKKSIEILGTTPWGLAYPFYDYNANAIEALKEAGFKMGFVGRAGAMGKATPKVTDLYKIPRMTVWEESIMSYSSWKSYL